MYVYYLDDNTRLYHRCKKKLLTFSIYCFFHILNVFVLLTFYFKNVIKVPYRRWKFQQEVHLRNSGKQMTFSFMSQLSWIVMMA